MAAVDRMALKAQEDLLDSLELIFAFLSKASSKAEYQASAPCFSIFGQRMDDNSRFTASRTDDAILQ